jgi:hypothetical protein
MCLAQRDDWSHVEVIWPELYLIAPPPISLKIMLLVLGYVKSNLIKHIAPKFFYPHGHQKREEINILQTKSYENLANLFTKSLLASSFRRCVYGIT